MRNADAEEREPQRSYEKGKWRSARPSKKTRERHRTYARAALAKDRRVNIRLPSRDVEDIQARAMEEGIPYQTLMASVLHKYATGRLVDASPGLPPSPKRPGRRRAVA